MKTFTKRVYFPVVSIMLVAHAHLTLEQISFIGAFAAIIQGVLQLPTGYIADKLGNRRTMLAGSLLSVPGALFYAVMPNFWGGLLGLGFYTAGYAFISGAAEALVHDTLVSLGRAKDYAKEIGRAQSIALGGNFILVSLVPLTYAIDFRLPFLIGFVCAILLVVSIARMTEPAKHTSTVIISPLDAMKKIISWQTISLFLLAGMTGGIVERAFDFTTLALVQVGIPAQMTGLVAAISSVVGALIGWYIFVFDRMRPAVFYLLDLVLLTSLLGAMSTQNAVVVVFCFVMFLGYARVRYIVFQSKLLENLHHHYKATVISTLSFFGMLGGVIAMAIFSQVSMAYGLMQGLGYFSAIMFAIGLVLWGFVLITLKTARARRG